MSVESILCVAVSDKMDLSKLNLEDLIGNIFGGENSEEQGSVNASAVVGETGGEEEGIPDEGNGENGDGTPDGGETPPEAQGNKIVTNYNDLLAELGFGEEEKEDLKGKLKTALSDEVSKYVTENGVDEYMGYYGYTMSRYACVYCVPGSYYPFFILSYVCKEQAFHYVVRQAHMLDTCRHMACAHALSRHRAQGRRFE